MDYPFSAITGQSLFKQALILAAINPSIGGVLISGPRGCAKSTLARGLADVLPGSPSFVTLPLGATEDMLVGTLNLQQVLNDREVAFHPGILAKAHEGVLYVDEVNLLADPLVDLLLDVSASCVNRVERDGISHTHAAEFLLIGTMNPDEGELRPQLRDRFGLMVELDNHFSIEERIEIVRRREAFDRNPSAFCDAYNSEQQSLRSNIARARQDISGVSCADRLRVEIAERCHAAQVDGMRADIVWYRAALANAAWNGRSEIDIEDIDAVEALVLAHRRNQVRSPKPPAGGQNNFSRPSASKNTGADNENIQSGNDSKVSGNVGQWGDMPPQFQETESLEEGIIPPNQDAESRIEKSLQKPSTKILTGGKSKGNSQGAGRSRVFRKNVPDWFRTLLTSAGQWPPASIRFRQRSGGCSKLHLVLLDTSGSTLKNQLFGKAKGVVASIAEQAYLERNQLVILGFGNDRVQTILSRRFRSPKDIRELLDDLPGGGGTPLRDVLLEARSYLHKLQQQEPDTHIHTYLLTDGRTRQDLSDIRLMGECTVIDIELSPVKRGRAEDIARELGAGYLSLFFNESVTA
ncbi:hypothetical protein BTA51_14305 [Hahella sp. CCB-MM4]|uniref:AAA family ATPase n=1 Tax=Hahella sp. (strain CCB-MM4) TaxID=1926491 RepID=UPI000B9C1852|nr:AAA family ATPase [Hahella sp. CCB-MM4]OZG72697.1 hypothetical protein BTA51_14305 [Hahella sp. CCB-MM4]